MKKDIDALYEKLKRRPTKYIEEEHCKLILSAMLNEGRISAFCVAACVCESTFYVWVEEHELFRKSYLLGRMFAKENWEIEGQELKNMVMPMGSISHAFEHWRLIGWSRFGISKNSRIKLNLKPSDNPDQHYKQILKQACDGDFTAAEVKQLMEAVNVGLNSHQVLQLQKEIDQLRLDLSTMAENSNVQNSFTNQGIAKKD